MKIKQRAETKLKTNPRFQALKILDAIENDQRYSNVSVDRFLAESPLTEVDNRLLVQLVYGVVQRRLTLHYYLAALVEGKRVEDWVELLLLMSIYQLVYLDRIPDHAVINEAVQIAKVNGHQGLGNFVNGVLRNFQRRPLADLSQLEDPIERLSVTYSIQSWIVEALLAELPEDRVETLLASLLEVPYLSARINGDPSQRSQLIEALADQGFQVEASPVSPYGIRCHSGNLIHSTAYRVGQLTIQDESSMLVAPLGQVTGTEQILDACAAPGGKATHIASLLRLGHQTHPDQPAGHLTALDLSKYKLGRVDQHLDRLGLSAWVTTIHADASKFIPAAGVFYDMIYLDAPCSGLGLMRRKPEIKYDKSKQDVEDLAKIQSDILHHVAGLLKPGGRLIYSTCTLTPQENEGQVDQFIEAQTDFQRQPITSQDGVPEDLLTDRGDIQVWPDQYHTDGFFISRLIKRK